MAGGVRDEVLERVAPKMCEWALMPKDNTGVMSSTVGIATKAITKSINIATLGVADKAMKEVARRVPFGTGLTLSAGCRQGGHRVVEKTLFCAQNRVSQVLQGETWD